MHVEGDCGDVAQGVGAVAQHCELRALDVHFQKINGFVEQVTKPDGGNAANGSVPRTIERRDRARVRTITDELDSASSRPGRSRSHVCIGLVMSREIAAAQVRNRRVRFNARDACARITALVIERCKADIGAAIDDAGGPCVCFERQRLPDEDVVPLRPRGHRVRVLEVVRWHDDAACRPPRHELRPAFQLLQHRTLRRRPDVVLHVAHKAPDTREQGRHRPRSSPPAWAARAVGR